MKAPTNKRPRWAHYGKPLKATIKGSTTVRQGRNKFHLYSAVGSTAPHAYYVDQGTGVFAGKGPYKAKILPPWVPGEASLYEHTWYPSSIPGEPGPRRVAQVMIKGQRAANDGKGFFQPGLEYAFRSMRMRSYQIPGEGVGGMTGIMNAAPTGLAGFLGNTPSDDAFDASLKQWREWRDRAWMGHKLLGKDRGAGSKKYKAFIAQQEAEKEAYLAAQGKGKAAMETAKQAEARRNKAEVKRLADIEKAKEIGRKKAEEKEKADAAEKRGRDILRANAASKRDAVNALRLIKKLHPDAQYGETKLADGYTMFWVRYFEDGERTTQKWAYGE